MIDANNVLDVLQTVGFQPMLIQTLADENGNETTEFIMHSAEDAEDLFYFMNAKGYDAEYYYSGTPNNCKVHWEG